MLNNNRIMREIAYRYKESIESAMDGWNAR